MQDYFLKLTKNYFILCQHKELHLDAIDLVILSMVEEFQRNSMPCFISTRKFSADTGISESSVKRRLKNLSQLGFLHTKTTIVSDCGQAKSKRYLSVDTQRIIDQISSISTGNSTLQETKQGSNIIKQRVKNEASEGHFEPLKDKIKYNKEDNNTSLSNYPFEYVVDTIDQPKNICLYGNDMTEQSILLDWDDEWIDAIQNDSKKTQDGLPNALDNSDMWFANGHMPNEDEIWAELDRQEKRLSS